MPNRNQIIEIIDATPTKQAIMLMGGHGIGKSEILTSHYESKGYRVITKFVGQMADAGDLIGMPRVVEKEVVIDGKTVTMSSTEFALPDWWPRDPTENVILFLDEVNRGKPEIMQCLMDLVLNRKMNGYPLPHNCRIIGGINPLDDGYYQVEDLDPAFLDRWKRYTFNPTLDEWTEWAFESGVDKDIIDFLNKHDVLDPPDSSDITKNDEVLPSRRSWVDVSDFKKQNPKIKPTTFNNYLLGAVGKQATALLVNYLENAKGGLTPGLILTKWDDKIEAEIKKYKQQNLLYTNRILFRWLKENVSDWKDNDGLGVTVTTNLINYFDVVKDEIEAQFMGMLASETVKNESWHFELLKINKKIGKRLMKSEQGSDNELDSWE